MKTCNRIAILLILAVAAVACATPKTLNYLQDMEVDSVYVAQRAPELKVHPDDKLGIRIYSQDPQLSAPFNSWSTTGDGSAVEGYIVDKSGCIDFPILGRLSVEGMTLEEIKKDISDRITSGGYIKEPIVTVSISNFDIAVLGETGEKIVNVDAGSINILELLARTSGTNNDANIKEVMVIRTTGDTRRAYSINLKSKDLFDSPAFYLQQNDIVYVKHRGVKFSSTGATIWGIVGTGLGVSSTIAYILLWTKLR
ncbi:MAG: polysaccharide biosynthesis/export family protein [Bacteroidales bacterium]|nr:polysaccharide biosynthesis/export family protein [Bacteroidales bacterium]